MNRYFTGMQFWAFKHGTDIVLIENGVTRLVGVLWI